MVALIINCRKDSDDNYIWSSWNCLKTNTLMHWTSRWMKRRMFRKWYPRAPCWRWSWCWRRQRSSQRWSGSQRQFYSVSKVSIISVQNDHLDEVSELSAIHILSLPKYDLNFYMFGKLHLVHWNLIKKSSKFKAYTDVIIIFFKISDIHSKIIYPL